MSAREDLWAQWRKATPSTLLYAPANNDRKASKVSSFGAEAVILDLEDAVPVDQKVQARAMARSQIESIDDSTLRMVRINNIGTGLAQHDIEGIFTPSLDGVVYPKLEDAEEIWTIDGWLQTAEAAAGLRIGSTIVIALIETAVGVSTVEKLISNVPDRLLTIGFGLGDFSLDMGVQLSDFRVELDYPRARLSIAARAAGLAYAVDGPWLRVPDIAGLREDSRRSRSFGFAGRQLIHPTHIRPANTEYLELSADRVDYYQRVVRGFEQAISDGSAALQIDGQLVDYPIYHQAQRYLRAYAQQEEA